MCTEFVREFSARISLSLQNLRKRKSAKRRKSKSRVTDLAFCGQLSFFLNLDHRLAKHPQILSSVQIDTEAKSGLFLYLLFKTSRQVLLSSIFSSLSLSL